MQQSIRFPLQSGRKKKNNKKNTTNHHFLNPKSVHFFSLKFADFNGVKFKPKSQRQENEVLKDWVAQAESPGYNCFTLKYKMDIT